ncbi:fibronectin type III domain-containing protein [Streptomyces humi]|uniref:fibronectin type III domain-containing protein n=1 Tax=Streptomyces humi TaxID=1428620 RepID=UPI0007C7875B|nr:PA14 domain-containing protein [Streptomyces humi]
MNPASRTVAAAAVLATAGTLLGGTAVTASAATACTSPVYKRQLFANTTFKGTPKKTDCDSAIDQSWSGAPASGLPKDDFGVRWTVTRDFGSGGPFALAASGLDGIRVYVDGTRRVDLWKNTSKSVSRTVNVTVPSGKHTIRVDYVNWTGAAKVRFAYTPRTSASVDKVKPLTPAGAAVSYDAATGRARLTWSKNKEMDLSGYRVYRRPQGTSFGGTPLATTGATSYTDSSLPVDGKVYYYEVRAYDKAGNASAGSADQKVTTADRTAPERVTGVAVRASTAGNVATWQASSAQDLDHYELWASRGGEPDPDGPEFLGLPSFTDATAEAGTSYTYTVRAVDTAGNVSPVSAPVTVTRPAASAVAAPAGLTATPADAATGLSWTPSGDPAVTGYHVYRRNVFNGAWTLLGSGPAASYEDTSAPRHKAYYYVAAVDGDGTESAPSAELTVARLSPATATGPAAPKLTLVSEGIPARSPVKVTAAPGAGDEDRGLQGYSWEVAGACGASGTLLSTTGNLSWTPPYNGPCTVTVFAVDAYGRQGEQSSSLDFFVGR